MAVFYLMLTGGSYLMPIEVYEIPKITAAITVAFALFFVVIGGLRWLRGFPKKMENANWWGWTLLAFGAIVTHPILDCFTAYGTQLLQPFASTRVAWNTISVADPIYTLPFLLLLIWARTRVQENVWRRRLNAAGLVLSSIYLALTVVNYFNVEDVMHDTLAADGIEAEATIIGPSILNNVLWSGTAKDANKDLYYFSQYSLFDEQRRFEPWTKIPGNHAWIAPYANDRDVRIIRWFTKGYYNVIPTDTAAYLQLADLRYGLIADDPNDPSSYIFAWQVDTTVHPVRAWQRNAGPDDGVDMGGLFSDLWTRLKGI
jgi:inner membrane protein